MEKDKKKLLKQILALILALVMVLGVVAMVVPVFADASQQQSSSEIKKEINALKEQKKEYQSKIKELQSQLKENMASMEEVVAQKNLIDQEIFLLFEQTVNINAQITHYGSLIADKQAELDEATARLTKLQIQNKARIRAMEKSSTSSYWSVVFNADNFLDMLDRLNTIYKINEADQRLIQELSEVAETVTAAKSELEDQKIQLEESKKELDATQVTLEEKRAKADALLAELVAQGDEYEALVEDAEQSKAELDSEIDDLEEEYDAAKDREYKAWYEKWLASQPKPKPSTGSTSTGGTGGAPNVTAGITWLKPCSYSKVSSPYGWRIHPVYKDQRFHYGIDLSAGTGTPIYATRSGTVTTAKFSSSGGFYVSIDHGDGFSSRYLHMTHYIVAPGQTVAAGQVIGYVGSTGVSTGPHLHFSLYYNGVTVNPADYINF